MALRDLIDELISLRSPIAQAVHAARNDASKRAEVMQQRRRYAATVRKISDAIDSEIQFEADPALAQEFRERFSRMHGKVAIFQAKWPASLMDGNPEFEDAARELRQSNQEFISWARSVLR
jgi:hypothetical protein